ncbi:cytochrome c oxidase subunit 3 [Microvirga sp. ACRRW]|uniref:cytochrome c oxidase subunit 3 n=1 Tax=Microvirga sp. ACRRW TaxID=2918205 RepID=UPI001EF5E243|nr:cytochrome c oxidase subunit 3 [Microvirga sp. ACRRW]MCG7393451.1 cytochrome c oxidase subunit 3 [Microvirga sp. ACRRW]
MGSILIFLSALLIIGAWWLSKQGLMSKPWLEQGVATNWPPAENTSPATARMGLRVFLAVVGSLFALFISAYAIRMQLPDWRSLPLPRILWLNTGMLILGSLALQGARKSARLGKEDELKFGLLAATVATLAFLSGQLLAWRQLTAEGYLLASNSANAFFYVLTGIHGLHILGGLAALGRTTARAWQGTGLERLQLSVDLCAIYWHFLLFIWFVLLSVLTGWAENVIDICRQLLS